MKSNMVAKTLFLIFLGVLGFIFAPVFMGDVRINDEMNVAVPETDPLFLRHGAPQSKSQSTSEECKQVSNN
jgi:hypothetical protein